MSRLPPPCVFMFCVDQVEKTQELTGQAKQKASAVTAQASAVGNSARGIEQAADKQKDALDKAKALMPNATTATEEALAAFRFVLFFGVGVGMIKRKKSMFRYCVVL